MVSREVELQAVASSSDSRDERLDANRSSRIRDDLYSEQVKVSLVLYMMRPKIVAEYLASCRDSNYITSYQVSRQ